MSSSADAWPPLPFAALGPTAETLQLWTQIVGKVRLARTPWVNHSWHVTLYVSARGLTTSLIPNGATGLELEFDFVAHVLAVRTTDGGERRIALQSGDLAELLSRRAGRAGGARRAHRDRCDGPTRCPPPRRSPTTTRRASTTRRSPMPSGARWSRPSAFSTASARASSAR